MKMKTINLPYKVRGLMSILGSFIIALSFGNFYTVGGLSPYVASYLHIKVDKWFNETYMVLVSGFFMLGMCFFVPLGGYLAPRIGSKPVLILGGVIYVGLSSLSGLALQHGFYIFIITYALLSWIGVGISQAVVMGEIMKWFPVWGGTSSAFVNAGFGLGGFILNSFQTYLINPDNLSPEQDGPLKGFFSDEGLLERVPQMFWKVGLLLASLQLVGMSMVFNPPNDPTGDTVEQNHSKTTELSEPSKTNFKRSSISVVDLPDISAKSVDPIVQNETSMHPRDVLKTREFYIIWVAAACQQIPLIFLITNYKAYGLTFIVDDYFLSTVGAVSSALSCIGKVGSGLISDRLSYKFGLGLVSLGLTVFIQCLVGAQYLEKGNKAYFTVFYVLGYIMVGATFGILPSVTAQAFGFKYAGINFGLTYSAQALGMFGGSFLVQVIVSDLLWKWSFTACIAFSVFSLILCMFMKRNDMSRRNR